MKIKGPWKVIKSTVKYENKYGLSVIEDSVIRPDNKEGIFGWIRMNDGVSVLAIDKDNNVYLGKEFQYGMGEECLEPISGGISEGEMPLDAAKRELKEELGITAAKWASLGVTNPISGRINTKQHLFCAFDLEMGEAMQEDTERVGKVMIPFKELIDMVMKNEIKDTQSSLLILLAEKHIKTQK